MLSSTASEEPSETPTEESAPPEEETIVSGESVETSDESISSAGDDTIAATTSSTIDAGEAPTVESVTIAAPAGTPQLVVTSVFVDFASVSEAGAATVLVELENVGEVDLTVTAVIVESPNGAYAVVTELPLTLAPGAKATVAVTMPPSASGAVAGSISVSSNDPDGDLVVPVSATGSAPEISSGGARAPPSLSPDGELVAVLDDAQPHEISITSSGSDLILTVNGSATTWIASSVTSIAITGAPDQDDTLTLDFRGGAIGAPISYEGGARGYDTLSIVGGGQVIASAASPSSGTITVDGTVIAYTGLEPITVSGSGSVVVDGTGLPEVIVVEPDGGNVKVSGHILAELTMETHFISLSGLTSLTINGAGSRDKVTIIGTINFGSADLTVNAEEIVLDGATITTTGNIVLAASDSVSGGIAAGVLNCVVPVLNGDPPSLGTHCAGASVTLDGASIEAASVTISATSTVTPDSRP
jgi:hypothetical protein